MREERGSSGARTATFQVEPDMGVAVEGTVAADVPGVPAQRCPSTQGKGPAITVADGNFIVPPGMVQAPSTSRAAGCSRGSAPCSDILSPFSTCRLTDFDHTP